MSPESVDTIETEPTLEPTLEPKCPDIVWNVPFVLKDLHQNKTKVTKKKYERLLQQGLGLGKLTQAQLPSTLCCQAFMKLVFELRKHHALGNPLP